MNHRRTTAKLKSTVAWVASMKPCGWQLAGVPSISTWRYCRNPPGRPSAATSLWIRRSPQGGPRDVTLPSSGGHPAPSGPTGVKELDDGAGPDLGKYCAVFARTPPQHSVLLGQGGSSPGQQAVMHPAGFPVGQGYCTPIVVPIRDHDRQPWRGEYPFDRESPAGSGAQVRAAGGDAAPGRSDFLGGGDWRRGDRMQEHCTHK